MAKQNITKSWIPSEMSKRDMKYFNWQCEGQIKQSSRQNLEPHMTDNATGWHIS